MHAFGVRLRYANLSNIIVSATVPKYEFKVSKYEFKLSRYEFKVSKYEFKLSKYEFKLSKYEFKLSKYEFKLSRQWRTLREILGGGGNFQHLCLRCPYKICESFKYNAWYIKFFV